MTEATVFLILAVIAYFAASSFENEFNNSIESGELPKLWWTIDSNAAIFVKFKHEQALKRHTQLAYLATAVFVVIGVYSISAYFLNLPQIPFQEILKYKS